MKNETLAAVIWKTTRRLVRPWRKFLRTVIVAVVCLPLVLAVVFNKTEIFGKNDVISSISYDLHQSIVNKYYECRESWELSKLGKKLFKNEGDTKLSKRNKTFTILIWRHWHIHQDRHIYHYGTKRHDPLEECSVTNCQFIGDNDQLPTVDAVIVHLQRANFPPSENRNPNQRWIFLNDESPHNVFGFAPRKIDLSELHHLFNWSMMYRSDSDIPVPYGRTVALTAPKFSSLEKPSLSDLVPFWDQKQRNVLVAILESNCVPYRYEIEQGLMEYIEVNVHGVCGKDIMLVNSCPGHFKVDCKLMSQYLFYLALENSKCTQYMTEKLFHNAYSKGAIPIIQGPSVEECKQYLPPDSYLHVDNYSSIKDLADDIVRISRNEDELFAYHKWRNHFDVINEHGYFGTKSLHLCRACEAMNYNDDTKSIYSEENIRQFLDPLLRCRK